MQARETQLRHLLEGVKQFHVPLFQRRYTWTATEHEQLWRDILTQYDALGQAQSEGRSATYKGSHFIGSFVLAPTPSPAHGPARFLVVDGQQRLTTLALALCALRDTWGKLDPEVVERISELYLVNKFQKDDGRYKVLPTQDDRHDFFRIVDSAMEGNGKQNRISEAYTFYLAKIGELIAAPEDDAVELERFEETLVSRLAVVDITADTDDNIHRIFESLNATGVALNQGDLLRNYIFMLLPSAEGSERIYTQLWKPMEDLIGDRNIEGLARLDLQCRGIGVLSGDVYREQQNRLRELEGNEAGVEAAVASFLRLAGFYQRILTPATESDPDLRDHLGFFQRWSAQTVHPVVMYGYDARDRGLCTTAELTELLLNLKSFLIRRLLAGIRGQNLNRIFVGLVNRLIEQPELPLVETARAYLSGSHQFWATDAELSNAIRTRPFYYYGRAEQKRMILEEIERSYAHKETADLMALELSVEHIMPQSMTAQWEADLREQGDNPEETYAELLHTLGNLTLTGYNPELSNGPFAEKRATYTDSLMAMNHPIGEVNNWWRAAILARAEDIADRLCAALPGPAPRTEPEREFWTPVHEAAAAVPPGYWTSYSDVAVLVGTTGGAVGSYLSRTEVANSHRILGVTGEIYSTRPIVMAGETFGIKELLAREGLPFDESNRAAADRHLNAANLQERISQVMGPEE